MALAKGDEDGSQGSIPEGPECPAGLAGVSRAWTVPGGRVEPTAWSFCLEMETGRKGSFHIDSV